MSLLDDAGEARLVTERLLLRALHRSDLAALDEAIRETLDELVLWLPWAHARHSKVDTRRYLKNARLARARRQAFEYAVIERASDRFVGITSIHRIDWARHAAELGYWVRRSCWGRGYASEAAGAVVEDAFRRLGLNRVEARVAPGNKASQRVPEKLGFQREGIARESEFVNCEFMDHIQYSLLSHELLDPDRGRPLK
jgi:RimJ/RimL family protein N-acetyltransferase